MTVHARSLPLLVSGQDYADAMLMVAAKKKLRSFELNAGAPSRKGVATHPLNPLNREQPSPANERSE
jgi:hypothetical protein